MQGLLAEFASAEGLLHAARQAAAAGYRDLDAYAPVPVAGLSEVIGQSPRNHSAGVLGDGANGFAPWHPATWNLPWLLPPPGWSALLPPPLRFGMVGAMLATMVSGSMWGTWPRLQPPPRIDLPADALDHYFLCISASDPQFDRDATQDFLLSLAPQRLLERPVGGVPGSTLRH